MFAKLFQRGMDQVLVRLVRMADSNKPAIKIEFEHKGCMVAFGPEFHCTTDGWEKAEKAFAKVDEEKAFLLVATVREKLDRLAGGPMPTPTD